MESLLNLGIDYRGVLVHLVNFGLLMVVLIKFLYTPIMEYLQKRQELIKRNITEAETIKKTFEEAFKKKELETEQKIQAIDTELAKSKKHAEEKAGLLIAEAEQQKEKILADARSIVAQMKSTIHEDIEDEILKRIEQTVMAVLKDSVSKDVIQKSISQEWEALKKSNA